MKLTIGMIVKNEEKYLDRCLSSIKPLLDIVDSELIITDTGSSDHTVEIAKKYTDKVLHFDWINDFSVARNTGIENAHGEWFMFLDADEIFQSCNGIISFFNSGEYKKYNSATYTVRNLGSDGGYSEFEARRMTKIFPETRFNGVIHEHLSTFKTPIKYISDIADHYGYVFNDDAERIGKFERNYRLLLKKYEQIKDKNPMIYAEMYDTLATGFKQKEADEYLEKGIEWCIKNEHPLLILMYCKKARHLLFEKQNDEALKVCDAYFGMSNSIRDDTLISDAEILAIKSTVFYRQENWSNAAETLAAFFPIYDDIKSGKLNTKDKMYGSLSLANDNNYLSYVGQFLVCCLNSEKYDFALNTLKKRPVSKYSNDRDTLESIVQLEVALLQNVGVQNLDALCDHLDEYGKQRLKESVGKLKPETSMGKVILTIGMIVKNEEKYLDRCLSAIKPILDNVNSELIITDTGSTDSTIEIARKYTDKVLHFDWINDFSAARNTAFETAKGEWFMFLDADDIFRSCDNIIKFFNSGEYKNYNSATYISNNPAADNVSTYTYNAQRITKLLPQTRFTGIVHEMLSTYGKPIKYLNDIADHYGYYYETEEDRVKKFERNSKLLLKRLSEESPVDPMVYIQLYETYMIVNKRAEADSYLDKGIAYARKCSMAALAVMYSRKAYTAVTEERYADAIDICKKYSDECGKRSADKEMFAIQSTAEFRLDRYEDALTSLKKFFGAYNEFEAGKTDTDDKDVVNYLASSEQNYLPFVCVFFVCCITLKKFNDALVMLPELKIKEHLFSRDDTDSLVPLELQLIESLGYEYLDKFTGTLDEYGRQKLAQEAEKLKLRKNRGNVVLTIGMIVKNEEKWLDKCLSGIKPILDNVDSELIITDTGSTDKTVEIAKKYTDKILHFEWINDFAAARNFGLEKAQGEWFMMLDADDIFRSCDHIIEFFNSGEYKNYNAASYISRNIIKTENGDSYSDILAPRMVKLHQHTRYENAIHESLNTFDPPYKNLQDIADHYGYYYETGVQRYNKFKRNTELLLKRFENEKETTPMLYVQLYEAYSGIGENEKALEYQDSGIELCKKLNSIVLASLYFYKVCHLRNEQDYEEAISVCDEYFNMSPKIRPYPLTTDGEIYGLKAECLYALERYGEAVDTFKKFFDIYRDIESGKIATYDSYLISGYMCTAVNIMPLFNHFAECCIKTEKFNTLDIYLNSYPFERYSFEAKEIFTLVQNELKTADYFSYTNIDKYYKNLDCHGKKILVDELFDKLKDADKFQTIIAGLGKIAETDKKIEEKLNIYKTYLSDTDCSCEINNFISEYGIPEDIDLLYIIMKMQYDLSPAFSIAELDLKQTAYLCCRNIDGFYEAAENYSISNISDISVLPDAAKFYDYCISMRLMDNEDKSKEEKEQLISKLFRIKNALNERYKRENSAKSEFELLAETVKKNIRAFIAKGDMDTAIKTLEDYKMINPGDPEIDDISREIRGSK